MAGFEKLRDDSNFFANELQRTSEVFSVVANCKIKGVMGKTIRDIKLFSAKLKLLQAKPFASSILINNQPQDNALEVYEETVACKIIENVGANYLTQVNAVKALISTSDKNLDPEMRVRKKAIIDGILEYNHKEFLLSRVTSVLKAKEGEYAELRVQWDKSLRTLKKLQEQKSGQVVKDRGPLYPTICQLVEKLERMRWLISQLVCTRSQSYDWVSDPHGRLSVLAFTRVRHTVDMFTQD